MQDDDWMLPRRLHSEKMAESNEQSRTNLRIDPEFLRQRKSRKQGLAATVLPPVDSGDNPWSEFDRNLARTISNFSEKMWTLGDTARWVIERTAEAVNGLSVDEDKLFDASPQIHRALADGEVSAFAITPHNPVPSELPAETWFVYELVIEEKNGLVRTYPLNSSSSVHDQHLLNVRVRRKDVLRRWPPSNARTAAQPTTTVGAENQCRRWLVAMMRNAPLKPKPKARVYEEALKKFSTLGKRGFDRAWRAAVLESNAEAWGAPGRRS